MRKKSFGALFAALAIIITGCNSENGPVSSETSAATADISETSYAEETLPIETTDEVTIPSETTSYSTSIEETTAEATPPSDTKAPITVTEATSTVTQAPPEITDPPVTQPPKPSPPTIRSPQASGTLTDSNKLATIDYSNTSDGYVMAKYTGSVNKIKVQIIGPNGVKQNYNLNSGGKYESYPLTGNNGSYTIMVLESVGDGHYAVAHSSTFNVSLSSSLAPYVRPSSYVPYSSGDSAVSKASQLCGGATSDLEKVDRIYTWLVDNVSYDYDLANSIIAGGYVADTEKVINRRLGICLDYAGTMAAMLRSQDIPTQLVVGHVSGATSSHAWVNVYVTDVGWVYGAIYFDGSAWHRMDPTYAASSNSNSSIMQYIGNGSNYNAELLY